MVVVAYSSVYVRACLSVCLMMNRLSLCIPLFPSVCRSRLGVGFAASLHRLFGASLPACLLGCLSVCLVCADFVILSVRTLLSWWLHVRLRPSVYVFILSEAWIIFVSIPSLRLSVVCMLSHAPSSISLVCVYVGTDRTHLRGREEPSWCHDWMTGWMFVRTPSSHSLRGPLRLSVCHGPRSLAHYVPLLPKVNRSFI